MSKLLTIYSNSVEAYDNGKITEYLLELLDSSKSKSVIVTDILKLCQHRENVSNNEMLDELSKDISVALSARVVTIPKSPMIIESSAFEGNIDHESLIAE